MKTAPVRDLRNDFAKLETWIREGEQIEMTKRGRLLARLVPATSVREVVKPDFMARLKETWGDRVFTAKEVEEMREAEREGDWG